MLQMNFRPKARKTRDADYNSIQTDPIRANKRSSGARELSSIVEDEPEVDQNLQDNSRIQELESEPLVRILPSGKLKMGR